MFGLLGGVCIDKVTLYLRMVCACVRVFVISLLLAPDVQR